MKIKLISATLMLAGFASGATYQYSNTWDVNVTQTIVGSTIVGHGSQATNTYIDLPYFDSSAHPNETLVGVSILYAAPLSGQPDSIVASISPNSGSTIFTSATASVNTAITSSDLVSVFQGASLDSTASQFDTGSFVKTASQTNSNITVASSAPLSNTLARDYSVTQFTSTDPSSVAPFNASGNFQFQVTSTVGARYSLASGSPTGVTFSYSGVDSGTLTVIYTTEPASLAPSPVPEPSAPLLGLIPLAYFMLRRRR